jgi:two-component system cell cycle sensor histidine kinase/response regulator CckA
VGRELERLARTTPLARVAWPGDTARAPEAADATVLLVEDEAPVRATLRRILERHGYTVLEARHGGDALLAWRKDRDVIDAVITDLRMPEMGGRELVAVMRRERPELPVVYISGYADLGGTATTGPREAFVEKPFTAEALLDALQGVLLPD